MSALPPKADMCSALCQPRAHGGIGEHFLAVLDGVKQACGVEHLEAWFHPDQKTDGGQCHFDGAHCDPLDRRRDLPELTRRVDFYLNTPAGALLDTDLKCFHPFMRRVVDRRRRQFHRELLRVRSADKADRDGDGSQSIEPALHLGSPHFCVRANRQSELPIAHQFLQRSTNNDRRY
jgi:hypothetical protein